MYVCIHYVVGMNTVYILYMQEVQYTKTWQRTDDWKIKRSL